MNKPKTTEKPCGYRIVNGEPVLVNESNLCDYFEPKRKTRYRACCRNCNYFTKPKQPFSV